MGLVLKNAYNAMLIFTNFQLPKTYKRTEKVNLK